MHSTRSILVSLLVLATPALAGAAGTVKPPEQQQWPFDGVLGNIDKPSVQRGLQVYKEVCSACHGIKRVPFRSLQQIGLSEAEVKAFAAEYTVMDGPNDDGEMFERPGRPSDRFPSPYPNDKAARAAQNGALPPDLSLIVKARPDGANYIYSLLTGYEDAPTYRCEKVEDGACVKFKRLKGEAAKDALAAQKEADAAAMKLAADEAKEAAEGDADAKTPAPAEPAKPEVTVGRIFQCSAIGHSEEASEDGSMREVESCTEMGNGMHYNPYFPGGQIGMAAPIADGQVTYQDPKTPTDKQQIVRDVVNFLQWAAEPEMVERKRMGIKVMLFLAIMTGIFYLVKKRIWSNLEH